jgi:hypothetical protein
LQDTQEYGVKVDNSEADLTAAQAAMTELTGFRSANVDTYQGRWPWQPNERAIAIA